jgi:Na+/H+-dicarboxylate symporter
MELLLELVLQIVAEFFADMGLHWFVGDSRERNIFLTVLVYALLGAALGALTLFFLPAHLIRNTPLRIANLVITPLVVASLMAWIGAVRRARDKRVVQMEEFVYAYATALTMAVVRFFGAA